jgi:hypothetical protein
MVWEKVSAWASCWSYHLGIRVEERQWRSCVSHQVVFGCLDSSLMVPSHLRWDFPLAHPLIHPQAARELVMDYRLEKEETWPSHHVTRVMLSEKCGS